MGFDCETSKQNDTQIYISNISKLKILASFGFLFGIEFGFGIGFF